MCHACVTESVKRRMLSRRDLFKAAPALAAAPAVFAAAPALAQAPSRVVDMTHTLTPDFPTYFGEQQFFPEQVFNFADNGFNLFRFEVNEHTGTHVDAPLHFSADGQSVDEIPVERLVAPLAVVDIKAKAAENADAQVTPDDLSAWMSEHGDLPEGGVIAMNSGWAAHLRTPKFRGADAEGVQHYPGFHPEAAAMLLEDGRVIGMAVDTLSLDHGPSPDFATHYAWLPTNRWGIENLAGLDDVPATGATLIVGAPKHEGGTGGPARVLALV